MKSAAKGKAKAKPAEGDILAAIDHPLRAELAAVRRAILGVDPSISEGMKWNSLSFRTGEWFATVNLRSRDSVQLVLHFGAKAGKSADPAAIPDPKGLLEWRGKDRALLTLGTGSRLRANTPALKAIIKAWLTQLERQLA